MTFRVTLPTAQAFARGTMWGSVVFNGGLLVWDLVRHEIGAAAAQSALIVALLAYLTMRPKLDRLLDARLEEALNRQEMSGHALAEMKRSIEARDIEINIVRNEHAARRH